VVAEKEVATRTFTLDRSLRFLAAVQAAQPPRPPLPASAIDEILLVHGWLQHHAEAVHVLDLTPLFAAQGAPDARHVILTGLAEELVTRVRLCSAPDTLADDTGGDTTFVAAHTPTRTAAKGPPDSHEPVPSAPASALRPGYAADGAA